MKIVINLFLFLIAFTVIGYSQSTLQLNKKNGNETIVKEGKRITVINKNGVVYHGKLRFDSLNYHMIIVGNNKINIDNIGNIKTMTLFSKITGGVLLLSGCALFVLGDVVVQSASGEWSGLASNAGRIYEFSGAIIFTSGVLFLTGTNHKAKSSIYRII